MKNTMTFPIWITVSATDTDEAASIADKLSGALVHQFQAEYDLDVIVGDDVIVYDEHGNEIYNDSF